MVLLSEVVGGGYTEFWNTRKFYRIVKGSKGSKKSKTTALWYIFNMMKYPDANLLVIRKVFDTLRGSSYTDLLWAIDKLQVNDYWRSSVSPLQITYIPTGQTILFRGMNDALRLASITVRHGYLCWAWFEEFSEITSEDDFNKVVMSIRGYIPPETGLFKQVTATFNPWSEHLWIKPRFFDETHDDVFAITTTYRCNEHLGEDDLARYKDLEERSPRAARVICYGEWGRAEGLIYENWEEKEFDIMEILKNPDVKTSFGLDFGYSVSYNAFVAIAVDLKARIMWIYDEMYERGMNNIDIAKRITQMGYGKEQIYGDCAEPKSISELQAGFIEEVKDDYGNVVYENNAPKLAKWVLPNIRSALKGGDSVSNGIQRVQSFKIYVLPKCTNTIMELNSYAYATDKNGVLTDQPDKVFDHLMDAIRYASVKFFMRSHGYVGEAKGLDSNDPRDAVRYNHVRRDGRCKRVVSSI